MEIERKFLVNKLPPSLNSLVGFEIRQGYIFVADNGFELRLRQKEGCYYQTIKQGLDLVRQEHEIELTSDQFETLWPLTANRRIQKIRYKIPVGPFIAELDIFGKPLEGLQMVEVEFETIEQSGQFKSPAWFGTEVTHDQRYKNQQLAIHGLPE